METSSKSGSVEDQTTVTTDTTSLNTSTGSIDLNDNYTEEDLRKAEEYKTKGNDAFKGSTYLHFTNN